ncbi:MAG: hypothetical protein ABIJ18_05135 [archaeon]
MDKKGELAPDQLVIIVGALVTLVILILILVTAQSSFLNLNFVSTTSCWASNGLKCGGGVFSFTPNMCAFGVEEEPVDEARLAEMLRDTYWMYHRAECDFGRKEVYTVYSFSPNEEMDIGSLLNHMSSNNRGKPVDSISNSDLDYIEENTVGNTICFDEEDFNQENDFSFDLDKVYFIHYFDIDKSKDFDDKIIVSSDSNFDILYWEDVVFPEQDGKWYQRLWALTKQQISLKKVRNVAVSLIPVAGGPIVIGEDISVIYGKINDADCVNCRCLVYGIPIEGDIKIETNE